MTKFLLTLCLFALPLSAWASDACPRWVSTYFSGEYRATSSHEGIAYIAIKDHMPSQRELATAENYARQALASQLESVVDGRTLSLLAEKNGVGSDYAEHRGTAHSRLKLRTEAPLFWIDEDNNVLWAKVSIPYDKLKEWKQQAPSLYMTVHGTKVHGIIYRFVRNEVWIKLEDGRSLRFKTEEFISIGDRVVVVYEGHKAKEVYCENVKLEGSIFHNARN